MARDWGKILNEPLLETEKKNKKEDIKKSMINNVRGIKETTQRNWDNIEAVDIPDFELPKTTIQTGRRDQPQETKEKDRIQSQVLGFDMELPKESDTDQYGYASKLAKLAKLGDIETRLNYEYGNKYTGLTNKVEEVTKELDKFMKENPNLLEDMKNDREAKNMFEKTFKFSLESAANLAPQFLRMAENALPRATEFGAGAAGAAAIAGQLGPQAAIPEEVATVPAAAIAGFGKGFKTGSAEFMYKLEKGASMREMVRQGVDPKRAQVFSSLVGAINAGLELTQIELAVGGAKKLKNILQSPAADVVKKGLDKKGAKVLKNLTKHVVGETGQEVVQELVGITGEKGAKGEDVTKLDQEDFDRLIDTAKSSAGAFTIMGGLGTIGGSVLNTASYKVADAKQKAAVEKGYKKLKDDVQEVVDRVNTKENAELAVKELSNIKGTNEISDVAVEDAVNQLAIKYDLNINQIAPDMVEGEQGTARDWDNVEPTEIEPQQSADTETDAQVTDTITETEKALEIDIDNVETTDEVVGQMDGQKNIVKNAIIDGEVVGSLEYSDYKNEPNVQMISVKPEYRRKGIATKLMKELQEKYPNKEINFGVATPEGGRLIESITETKKDPELSAKFDRLEEVNKELQRLQSVGIDNLSESELDSWNPLSDEKSELENELRGKEASKTFVKLDKIDKKSVESKKKVTDIENKIKSIEENTSKLPFNLQLFAKKKISQARKIIDKIEAGQELTKTDQRNIDRILSMQADAIELEKRMAEIKKVETPRFPEDKVINFADESYVVNKVDFDTEQYTLKNLKTNETINQDIEVVDNVAKTATQIKPSMNLDKRELGNVTNTKGIMNDFPNLEKPIANEAGSILLDNQIQLEKRDQSKDMAKHNKNIKKLMKEKDGDVKISDYLQEEIGMNLEQAKERAADIYSERDTPGYEPINAEYDLGEYVKTIIDQTGITERGVINSLERIADGVVRTKNDKKVELMLHDTLAQLDDDYNDKLGEKYVPKYKTPKEKELATRLKREKERVKRVREKSKLETRKVRKETKAKERAKREKKVIEMKQEKREQKERARAKRARSKIEKDLLSNLKELKKKKDKMFPVFEEAAGEILDVMDLNARNISEKKKISLTNSRDYFEQMQKEDPSYETPESIRDEMTRLERVQIGNMTDQDILSLNDVVDHLIHMQKFKEELVYKNNVREINKVNEQLDEAINLRGKDSKADDGQSLTPKKRKTILESINAFKEYIYVDGALRPETQAGRIAAYDRRTELFKILYEDIDTGQSEAIKTNHRLNDQYVTKMIGFDKTLDTDKNYVENFRKKYNKFVENMEKEETIELSSGKVDIQRGQMVMLYIHSLIDFNQEQVIKAGVVSPGLVEKHEVGGVDQRTRLQREDLAKVADMLTESEKDIAAYWFELSQDMGGLINEVSVRDVGFNIVKDTDGQYAPTNRSSAYRKMNLDGAGKRNLGNLSFLKKKTGGSAPIVLENFTTMLERQIELGSQYYGIRLPSVALKKMIENPKFNNTLKNSFGDQTVKSFVDLYDKLNGVRSSQDNMIEKAAKTIIGNSYQAILGLNPKIMLYQPISIAMAKPEFASNDLGKGIIEKSVDNNLMYKYSDLIRLRAEGYINREAGELRQRGKGQWQTKGIQAADMLAIKKIWNASENFVKRTKPDLRINSDKFYQEVAKKAESVIKRTQPNYTTMQRSQMLRSDSIVERLFTAFSTQRNQNYNNLYESIDENNIKQTAETKTHLRDVVGSFVFSAVMIAAIKSMYSVYRGREPEFVQKVAKAIGGSFYGLDVIVNSALSGYDYDNMVEGTINKFINSVKDAGFEATGVQSSKKTALGHVKEIFSSVAQMSGYSVDNATREAENIARRLMPKFYYEFNSLFEEQSRTNMYNVLKDTSDKNLHRKIINDLKKEENFEFRNIEQSVERDGDLTDNEKKKKIKDLKKLY